MLLALATLIATLAPSATYHVSSRLGDDSRTAAQAQEESTPWRTLQRLDSVVLRPGDSVLLRRGDTLRGTLVPRQSAGTWSSNLVVGAYGPGSERPWILGGEPLQGWVASTRFPGTYEARGPANSFGALLEIDGRVRTASRLPDTGWFPMDSPEGDSAFTATSLPTGDWMGAWVHLKSTAWNIDARRIARQSGKRLSLDAHAFAKLQAGWGWFVSGDPRAIAGPDRWAQDSVTGTVWWRPGPADDPTRAAGELAVRPCGISLRGGRHDIEIRDLGLSGQTENGICGEGSSRISVSGVHLRNVDQWGVRLWGTANSIRDTRVEGATTGGLGILGPRGTLERDTVLRIGDLAAFGPRGHWKECCGGRGININGDSSALRRSVVRWTGWTGVHFSGKDQILEENVVDSAVQIQNDGGAFYTFSLLDSDSNGVRSVVRRNIARDTRGNTQGASHGRQGQGIYLDGAVQGLSIRENVVAGCQDGILFHDGHDDLAVGNILFGNAKGAEIYRDTLFPGVMRGNRFDSNQIVGFEGQVESETVLASPNPDIPISAAGNIFCQVGPVRTTCTRSGIPLWSAERAGVESTGTDLFPVAAGYGVRGWQGYPTFVKLSKLPEDSPDSAAFHVRYAGDTAARPTGLVLHVAGAKVDQGELTRLRFSARADAPGMRISPVALQGHDRYRVLANGPSFDLDTFWHAYSATLRMAEADTNARVDFHLRTADSGVSLRAIRWEKLDTSGAGRGPRVRLVVAAGPSSVPYDPGPDAWYFADGTRAGSGVVPGFSAIAYLAGDSQASIRVPGPPRDLVLRTREGSLEISWWLATGGRVRARLYGLDGKLLGSRQWISPSGPWTGSLPAPGARGAVWCRLESPDGTTTTQGAILR